MFGWISKHKEWIFGGIGTAVVVAVISANPIDGLSSPSNPSTAIPTGERSATATPIPRPLLRQVSIEGHVLSGILPAWVPDPPRGSITFNKDTEIAATGRLTAHLTFRSEDRSKWATTTPVTILDLRQDERFCKITRAEHDVKYWLGFQAHCKESSSCSYNVENNKLWATIGDIDVILAQPGAECP